MRLILLAAALLIFSSSCRKDFSLEGNTVINPGTATSDITAKVEGRITNEFGEPVQGALISVGAISTNTNINGEFFIDNAVLKADAALVKISKTGYFPASRTFRARQGHQHSIEVQLIPKTSIGIVNGSSGGTITVANGSEITLPANGIVVESSGAIYTGAVKVEMAWIDPSLPSMFLQMPGDLRGVDTNNKEKPLQSYGMLAVELTGASGEKLQIATGKRATLKFPIPSSLNASAPTTIPLWSYKEETGLWKEEGKAIKNGTVYIGDVTHFSFWNCDFPFDNAASLLATFLDQNGQPLSNIHVEVHFASGNYTGAHGMPDSSGYINARVPSGQPLVLCLAVFNSQCSGPLFSKNIGPFVQGSNNNLGTITVNMSNPLTSTISGMAVDCNNNPVSNGLAEIRLGNVTYRSNINNGNFSFNIITCSNQTAVYTITNNAGNQQSAPAIMNITPGSSINLGTVAACGISTLQFINYVLDGVQYNLTNTPSGHVNASDSGQTGIDINGFDSAQWLNNMFFTFNSHTIGTYNLVRLHTNRAGGAITPTLQTNPIAATITELNNFSGGFIAGSFSGSYISATDNLSHSIQCNFRVKKQ